jgi:hypothetical protein
MTSPENAAPWAWLPEWAACLPAGQSLLISLDNLPWAPLT